MDKKKVRKYYLATIECLFAIGETKIAVGLLTAMVAGDVKKSIALLTESKKHLTHEKILDTMGAEFRFWEVEELPAGASEEARMGHHRRDY